MISTEDMISKYINNGGNVTICNDRLNGSDTQQIRSGSSRVTMIPKCKLPKANKGSSINYTGSYHDIRRV